MVDLHGQSAADLETLDRLNILAEYAANKGLGRIEKIDIYVGDLLDLRTALAGRLGEGAAGFTFDSPALRTLRAFITTWRSLMALGPRKEWYVLMEQWLQGANDAIGRELHWRSDLRDVVQAGLLYAQAEGEVKNRHLAHERRLLGALFRLLDRP